MTVRIIKGSITHNEVPFIAHTSQCVIENVDEAEAERLISLGVAEKADPPPKPLLRAFRESPEKIRAKIAELEPKLAEADAEHEVVLDDDLGDTTGIVKKIDAAPLRGKRRSQKDRGVMRYCRETAKP